MGRNIAVVGMGYWGKNLVRNFDQLAALHTVCDENTSVEADVVTRYPLARYSSQYQAVLRDSQIAGVVLATPARTHFELAKLALENGKDVFVEKPLALKVSEGETLVDLADRY